jgi:hypothetical protein
MAYSAGLPLKLEGTESFGEPTSYQANQETEVVACLRLVSNGKVTNEVRTRQTTTADLLRLSEWLSANECTHVAGDRRLLEASVTHLG